MIVCNGIVGMCLLWGGARHHEQGFQLQGCKRRIGRPGGTHYPHADSAERCDHRAWPVFQYISAYLCRICLAAALWLVCVRSDRSSSRLFSSGRQQATTRRTLQPPSNTDRFRQCRPSARRLVAIVGLAKALTPTVEIGVASLGVPEAVVGIVIAALVLLPEGLAALRAAQANRLQTSLNLALGSALASIGLTIPAVAAVSIVLHRPLELGLNAKEQMLLFLTLLVGVITLGHRPDHGAAGHRSSGHFRCVFILRRSALILFR